MNPADRFFEWYDGLTRRQRDAIDQTGHFLLGLVFASLGSAALAWAFFHRREFLEQAPIERIHDTERDMAFGLSGACWGQVVHSLAIVWIVRVAAH